MRMRSWTGLLAGGVLGLSVLLVGCSGDDESISTKGDSGGGGSLLGAPAGADGGDEFAAADADFGEGEARGTRSAELFATSAESVPAPRIDGGVTSGSLDLLGRTIIRNGSVSLVVESVPDAFSAVSAIATSNGGFVANSSLWSVTPVDEHNVSQDEPSGTNGDLLPRDDGQRGRLTIRVPADRFEAVVADLRDLAIKVTSVSTSSQDVTEQFTDQQAQLRNLRAVEAQYLSLLDEAKGIGEIFQVQDRLNQVRWEIERVTGRIQPLESLSELATITIDLSPEAAPFVAEPGSGDSPLDAAREAWSASLATLSVIATVALVAVVYSWWLLPVLLVLAVLLRRYGPMLRPRHVAPIDTPQGTA